MNYFVALNSYDYCLDSDPLTANAQWFVPQVSSREIVEMISNIQGFFSGIMLFIIVEKFYHTWVQLEFGQVGDFLIRERRSTHGYALSVFINL